MYLVYADESGDSGLAGTPGARGQTEFFVISGIIVHETHWNEIFQRFLDLRRNLSRRHSIPQRIAFHAYDMVNGHGDFHHSQYGLTRPQRFQIYREIFEFLSQLPQMMRVLNVFIRKDRITDPDTDVFEWGWQLFIQRFHNYLDRGGQHRLDDEYGLLFTDRTRDDHLRRLMRRMRAFNYVPSRFEGGVPRRILISRVLDDPVPRASPHSYYVQMADLIAFALARRDFPRGSLRRFGFEGYFDLLDPLLLREASQHDPQGVVYWPRPRS